MSPLDKRIAYKKKSGFNFGRFIIYLVIIAAFVYILFYHNFNGQSLYKRTVGFFKSEIEKSPSVSIRNAEKEIKKILKTDAKKETGPENSKKDAQKGEEGDEIEEVIKKKLDSR